MKKKRVKKVVNPKVSKKIKISKSSKISKKRVPTGIPGFDKLIQGGFKRKSINLVAGGPGSGKTILAVQFLMNGIKKYGETTMYLTFEEKKEKLYDDMFSFGWDLAKYEKEKKFIFLKYEPEQVKKLLVEGGGIIESIIEKNKITRLVIDSITSFSLLYQDELAKKEAALGLFELIGKWNCTAVLTSQEDSYNSHVAISAALEFEVDSILILYHKKEGKERKRTFEILKMRGTKHPGRTYNLAITQTGIKIG